MTQDSELQNKKLLKGGGASLYMAEWPEKGQIRRRWAFQKVNKKGEQLELIPKKEKRTNSELRRRPINVEESEKSVKGNNEKVKKMKKPKEESLEEMLKSNRVLEKSKRTKNAKIKEKQRWKMMMVEPDELSKSSPISELPESPNGIRIEREKESKRKKSQKDSAPIWKKNKQARVEEMERREFEEEQRRERKKKNPSDSRSQKTNLEKSRKRKPRILSLKELKKEDSLQKPKLVEQSMKNPNDLEKKVDHLTHLVENLISKMENLQKPMSDEQRIRNSANPQIPILLDKMAQMFLCLHSHYTDLIVLDAFDAKKCKTLKKIAEELHHLCG